MVAGSYSTDTFSHDSLFPLWVYGVYEGRRLIFCFVLIHSSSMWIYPEQIRDNSCLVCFVRGLELSDFFLTLSDDRLSDASLRTPHLKIKHVIWGLNPKSFAFILFRVFNRAEPEIFWRGVGNIRGFGDSAP